MAEYIRFSLADGGHILVESAAGDGVQLTSRAARAVDAASESFGGALSSVRKAGLPDTKITVTERDTTRRSNPQSRS
ncbi:MAG: hypothetical protein ACRDQ4_13215 [Pseudonocardiaceae bacterium]